MTITLSPALADLTYYVGNPAKITTLTSFSWSPSSAVTSLTEVLSYPTFVADPSTVFTYETSTRAFTIYTTDTSTVGDYYFKLKGSNSNDATNFLSNNLRLQYLYVDWQ